LSHLAIDARAGHQQQRALPPDQETEEMKNASTALMIERSYKSRSIVNCPIFACRRSISRSRAASASRPTLESNARAACFCSCFFQAYIWLG
jgi:hypothetical protein